MEKNDKVSAAIKNAKIELGNKIKLLRTRNGSDSISLRKLAEAVGLPPSNMKYIEDGINAPSPDMYDAIIRYLSPDSITRRELDHLYTIIRGTPPPDVCRVMCVNEALNDALRMISDQKLTAQQLSQIMSLFSSFQEKG